MKYKGFIVPRTRYISRIRDADINEKAKLKLSWMDFYEKTKNARLTCRHLGISPDTFYRWKKKYRPLCLKSLEDNPKSRRPHILRTPQTTVKKVERILSLREEYPRWGKEKIAILLKREGITMSVSSVGRTIKRLQDRGILKEPIPNFISAKKRFIKRKWAVRKPFLLRAEHPGDLVEVDTLDVRPVPGLVRKQFTARDIISKWDVIKIFGSARSSLAMEYFIRRYSCY